MDDDCIYAKECASLFVNGTECPTPRSCVIKGMYVVDKIEKVIDHQISSLCNSQNIENSVSA